MNKKYKTILICIFIVILILIGMFFVFNKKSNNPYSISGNNHGVSNSSVMITLNNESVSQLDNNYIKQETEKTGDTSTRQSVISSPGTPFYSSDGWVSNVVDISDGAATIEIYNNSQDEILIDDTFVSYLGVNDDDSPVVSTITQGNGEIVAPGQTIEVKLNNGGDAKYLKVGYTNMPKYWAFYPVKSFMDRVNNEDQIVYDDTKNSDTFVLDATISPHLFKSLNIGTQFSRKISDTKYEGITLSKEEKKQYPYATLGYINVDIYNKTKEPLIIDSMDLLFSQNEKVINTETIDYTNRVFSQDCNIISIPFKYYGSNISTSIVLKTNKGNITIHKPELLFGVVYVG